MEMRIIFTSKTSKKLNSAVAVQKCKVAILLLLQIFMVVTLKAQTKHQQLPKAEDLFGTFVEKTGGQEAYDRICNRLTKSKMEMSSLGISGKTTAYATNSGQYYISVDSTQVGKLEFGSDGKTVWDINPVMGSKVRTEMDRLRYRCLYSLNLPAKWRTAFRKIECTGIDTIQGQPAYKVIAVNNEDYQMSIYFDLNSGLIVKTELPLKTLAGPGNMEIFYSEYEVMDGISYPRVQRSIEQGREMTRTLYSVEHNIVVPEGTFVLPDIIKKIVETVK
jgi:hypothetical protein